MYEHNIIENSHYTMSCSCLVTAARICLPRDLSARRHKRRRRNTLVEHTNNVHDNVIVAY